MEPQLISEGQEKGGDTETRPLHSQKRTPKRFQSISVSVSVIATLLTVRADIITEWFLERAGPIIFKTVLLELKAFQLIPVIFSARRGKPENYWKR